MFRYLQARHHRLSPVVRIAHYIVWAIILSTTIMAIVGVIIDSLQPVLIGVTVLMASVFIPRKILWPDTNN